MANKYLFCMCSFCLCICLLAGCKHNEQIKTEENTSIESGSTSEKNNELGYNTDTGTIQSGLLIQTNSGNIFLSGNMLSYNNIFTIYIDTKIATEWEYNWNYNNIIKTSNYQDISSFRINDIYYYGINITINNFNNINTIKTACTPSYEEGINYKPKTHTLTQGDQIYYLTYALFDITAPDTIPSKNYQSEICFIKNDKIYYITISNPTHYRKDIVESLKFL